MTLDQIQRRFRNRGLKSTPQRIAIYQALAESTQHPTAEDLHKQVSQSQPMISLNTVYYTLSVLKRSGLVQEVNYGHERARFDANVTPHHHAICIQCQRIQDIIDKRLDRMKRSSSIPKNFTVTEHQVQFYGYCQACQPVHHYPPQSGFSSTHHSYSRRHQ